MFNKTIIRVLLLTGALMYFVAVFYIGIVSLSSPNTEVMIDNDEKIVLDQEGKKVQVALPAPTIPAWAVNLFAIFTSVLALHTGRQLGIETDNIIKADDDGNKSIWGWIKEGFKKIGRLLKKIWGEYDPGKIPMYATFLYIVSLFMMFIFYALEGFSASSAESIRSSWTALIGLALGAWTIEQS